MLPPFSLDQTVLPETGRQDRLEFILDLGKLEGSTNQIDLFQKALAPVPDDGFDTLPSHGWIFTRPSQQNARRFPQKIRKTKAPTIPHAACPLFGGILDYGGYYRRHRDDVTESSLKVKLNCNPTRYARLNPPRPNGLPPIFSEPFERPSVVPADGEMATDGNDNWIPSGDHDAYYSPFHWRQCVRRYIQEIRLVLLEDIRTARGLVGIELQPRDGPRFTLEKAESYWEFTSPNPVGVLHALRHGMSGFASRSRDTEYEGNKLALRYRLNAGTELCIYAKTDRRIRFEVRHALREQFPYAADRCHNSLQGVLEILDACNQAAAIVVNNALAHMKSRGQIVPSQINEALLLIRVGRVIKNDSLAVLIVEILRSRGGIPPDNRTPALRRGIERLQYHGILRYDAHAKLYVPTPDYAHAAITLRSRPDTLKVYPKRGTAIKQAAPAQQEARVYPKRNAAKHAAPAQQEARVYPKRNAIKHAAPAQQETRVYPKRNPANQANQAIPTEEIARKYPKRSATN